MKRCKSVILAIILAGITVNVAAIDLMDVYKNALANDPKFKAARAQWLADRENLAISKSALLPQITAEGSITRNYNDSRTIYGDSSYYNTTAGYSLKLVQSIFSFGNWANVWQAQAIAKKAQATFLAAEEDLLIRVAQAYFSVLQAKDILSYAQSKKREASRLYTQAKRKYEVGLIAIVDIEDARKNYYVAVSEELKATNDLSDQFEKLNEITGVRYHDLDPLKDNFPLLSPEPAKIEKWVKAARQQNFTMIANRYAAIEARENVKIKNAGHLPTITAEGGYSYSRDNNALLNSLTGERGSTYANQVVGGLGVSLPIFQGGGVAAAARQAGYQYQAALAKQEQTDREVASQTRQTYLGILSNISKIRADIQAIKASKSSLRATEANYSVGTRTMADVLTAQAALYEAQQNFAQDEYNYILQLLNLKSLTGILAVNDLAEINSWLKKPAKKNNSNQAKSKQVKNKTIQPGLAKSKIAVFNTGKIKQATNQSHNVANKSHNVAQQ